MHLDRFRVDRGGYTVGAGILRQILWHFFGSPLVRSSIVPFSTLKVAVLRLFGASIGCGVRVKPGVRVKFPWRLTIGDHCWLGEESWIDNLAEVTIMSHACVSQGAYLCTGSHDWSRDTFDLITKPIVVESHAWVGAKSVVAPGVVLHEGAVLGLGSVATTPLERWTVYLGTPACAVRPRPREDAMPDASPLKP